MKKIKQAVILAGGRGERLKPITDKIPKPMVLINGKPFLEHLIEMLKEEGIKEVLILTGYLEEKIKQYFGDGKKFGIKIKYSFTPFKDEKGKELESGLRLKNATDLLDDIFLLIYCDNYWPLQLEKLNEFYKKNKTDVLVTVYSNKDNFTKNNILVNKQGYVLKYDRKREDKNLNGVEIGFFIINKKVLKIIPKTNSHFERDILPKIVSKKQLSGFLTDHPYYSISTPERVKITKNFLLPKRVIFLDRDGVINKKANKADYIKNWTEFKWLPGVIEALKLLTKKGYNIYIISNQPGIARGIMKKEDLLDIQNKMEKELAKNGVKIAGTYFCLHGWHDNCDCRKPKPGLLFQAAREHNLNLRKVTFIGDDERDIEAGKIAGCKTIFLKPGTNFYKIIKSKIVKNT